MSTANWLVAFGAVMGLVGFIVMRKVADRIELGNATPTARDSARVLRIAAVVDLIAMPAMMYVVARLVF